MTLSHAANLSGSSLYRNVVDTCMGGATAWCELRWSPAWIARAASESCFSSFFFISFFSCCCCTWGAAADKSWCAICSMTSPSTACPSGSTAPLGFCDDDAMLLLLLLFDLCCSEYSRWLCDEGLCRSVGGGMQISLDIAGEGRGEKRGEMIVRPAAYTAIGCDTPTGLT